MKMRNKGKVHPSPSSSSAASSSAHHSQNKDALSVLKLLPAAILAIASVLSLEDREVLAYMITRSMKSTNPSAFLQEKNKKNPKNKSLSTNTINGHKPPLFDCECFDCYTSFWFRWDSSPNRELIHQAIEAFEEHLNYGEQSKKGKNRKRDKMGRRGLEKRLDFSEPEVRITGSSEIEEVSSLDGHISPENGVSWPGSAEVGESDDVVVVVEEVDVAVESPEKPETGMVVRGVAADNHKGLARKVLPDVLGLLNSRLWNLWSPNV